MNRTRAEKKKHKQQLEKCKSCPWGTKLAGKILCTRNPCVKDDTHASDKGISCKRGEGLGEVEKPPLGPTHGRKLNLSPEV